MANADSVSLQFSKEQIAQRIAHMGEQIRLDAGTTPVMLIAILKGSAVFFADLLRAIPGEVSYGFVDVYQEQSDTETAEATELNFMTHFDIVGRQVYLLKDVVTTGVIETYLISQFRQKRPKDLKLVALLDRPGMRTVQLEVDYKGFEVEGGVFVGYGLELRGLHGNLPYIGTL